MDWTQVVFIITSLANVSATILAWIAKIRWADEYSRAKNETIRSKEALLDVKEAQLQTIITNKDEIIRAKEALVEVKDAQIQSLNENKDEIIKAKDEQIRALEMEVKNLLEFSPPKIREYFLSVKEQLEEYNDLLKNQLEDANNEIDWKNEEIFNLQSEGAQNAETIQKLIKERDTLSKVTNSLEAKMTSMRGKYESRSILFQVPSVDVDLIKDMDETYKQLSEILTKNISEQYKETIANLIESYQFTKSHDLINMDFSQFPFLTKSSDEPKKNIDKKNTDEKRRDKNNDTDNGGEAADGSVGAIAAY